MKNRLATILTALLLGAACSAAGGETVQTFEFEYPDSELAPVVLDIRTGTLNLSPASGSGVRGQVTTNVQAWQVEQGVGPNGEQRVSQGEARNQVIPNADNRWDVEMGTGTPLMLTINSLAASGNLELGGLSLRSLIINGTSGSYTLGYNNPNPSDDGGVLQVQLTSGSITASGISNSHIRELQLVTTGGNQTVEFGGGGLVQDLRGSVETTSGDVTLRIPIGTAARITFSGASGRAIEVSPEFERVSSNVFATAEYADGVLPNMELAVRTIAGDLRLVSVPRQ